MYSLSREAAGKPRILIVEEATSPANGLTRNLQLEGYEVIAAHGGRACIDRASEHGLDIVLLELNLEDMDGLDVVKDLRANGVVTPIIVVTARVDEVDRVAALRLGADDYVSKPFSLLELIERIKIQIRNNKDSTKPDAEEVQLGAATIEIGSRHVRRGEKRVQLRPKEFDLFCFLWAAGGTVVSKDQLLRNVWGFKCEVETRTLDFHVATLREKIESDPSHPVHLLTVRGVGYRLIPWLRASCVHLSENLRVSGYRGA
jgi:DNA-binding response OmpR family regulator